MQIIECLEILLERVFFGFNLSKCQWSLLALSAWVCTEFVQSTPSMVKMAMLGSSVLS